ncbi:MAG: 50S ribosomal protein L24 [Planctomycetota bacterium]
MAARVRKDDIVEVINGDHKGARGKVLKIDPTKQRVVVEGVNMVYRHVRRSRKHPQGGRIQKEAAIHLSNVMPVDPKTGRGTRVRFTVSRDADGKVVSKQRVSMAGTVLSEVTRATGEYKSESR